MKWSGFVLLLVLVLVLVLFWTAIRPAIANSNTKDVLRAVAEAENNYLTSVPTEGKGCLTTFPELIKYLPEGYEMEISEDNPAQATCKACPCGAKATVTIEQVGMDRMGLPITPGIRVMALSPVGDKFKIVMDEHETGPIIRLKD